MAGTVIWSRWRLPCDIYSREGTNRAKREPRRAITRLLFYCDRETSLGKGQRITNITSNSNNAFQQRDSNIAWSARKNWLLSRYTDMDLAKKRNGEAVQWEMSVDSESPRRH